MFPPKCSIHILISFLVGCSLSFQPNRVFTYAETKSTELPAKQRVYFEKSIRPILVKHCYECHSQTSEELGGNLSLDSKAGWEVGGDSGTAIVPGHPGRSLIVKAVQYKSESLQMPPDGKLSRTEISHLIEWVRMGAPDPRVGKPLQKKHQVDLEQGREFWSFQPIRSPAVPQVKTPFDIQSPIDAFIAAKWEKKHLSPNGFADKRTLIRRATFNLTGLPPSVEEVESFLQDDSATAFEKVINRLLASNAYGERWGRHWLDVVRYADSNGLDENIAHGNAWRYRDYVVNSFNNDKPFDQFILEQLAGDLLPKASDRSIHHERIIATGFLSLGPKVLAEPDLTKMEMDIIDEQISTMGQAILGLTLGCARCHDHKFDPFTMSDYYALAGIFKSTRTMETFQRIAKWAEHPVPTEEEEANTAKYNQDVQLQKQRIDAIIQSANQELLKRWPKDAKLPQDAEKKFPQEVQAELKAERAKLDELEKHPVENPTAMGVSDQSVTDLKIHIRGSHLNLGKLVQRNIPEVFRHSHTKPLPKEQSGRLELAKWLIDSKNPLTARVMVNRIWRWHFGRGIVASTDNFGELGSRPTHPLLLDWLADHFIKNGWSIKQLHRTIMLSSTYRLQSEFRSVPAQQSAQKDPENQWYWKFSPRRLEAEAIRDSMLFVSGMMDRKMGGSLLHVKNREFFFDHTSKDGTNYNSNRRSIYLPVVRNHLYETFSLFDYSDASMPNGNRNATIVAPQALFMMNSQFMIDVAKGLAKQLESRHDDSEKLLRLYLKTYGRPPTPREIEIAQEFLKQFEELTISSHQIEHEVSTNSNENVSAQRPNAKRPSAKMTSWESLCQMVLASSEFIYIR